MKNHLCLKFLFLFFVIFSFYNLLAQTIVTQSTAGGTASSASYQMMATVGQPVTSGESKSDNYFISGGFLAAAGEMDMAGPIIVHTPIQFADQGQSAVVNAVISDDSGIASAVLLYRKGGQAAFTSLDMQLNGGEYQAEIPDSAIASQGVEYFIQARDIGGNLTRQPAASGGFYSIRVNIGGQGVPKLVSQPHGSEQSAYRLISIPIDAADKSAKAVFADDLGAYDKTKWRLFELRTDQKYYEYSNIHDIAPAEAFFLIVKASGKIIDSGAGTTIQTDQPYEIPLDTGYTFIGNPFNFNIPLANVTTDNAAVLDIQTYDKEWVEHTGALQPYEGYLISTTSQTTLKIDPDLSGGTQMAKSSACLANAANPLWEITIKAICQEAQDSYNILGVHADASVEADDFDRPEPPVIGEYVSVYFPHAEWNNVFLKYRKDYRPQLENGAIWDFEVKTNIREKVQLTFSGIDNVPAEYEVWLLDKLNMIAQNLHHSNIYNIKGAGEDNPIPLKVLVGDRTYVQQTLETMQLIPKAYTLFQNYPNPFNPATTIRFALPNEEQITLKVYDILGREVITLLNKEIRKSGYHKVIWDGKDSSGNMVASSVYIYEIKAGKFYKFRKMVLLK